MANMFNEDEEYWTLAERLLDAYDLEEILFLAELDLVNVLVELQLAGVLSVDEDTFPELFNDDDE